VNDGRPPLRNWTLLALTIGDRSVELRIERKTFPRHEGPRARTRLVRLSGISSGATMSLDAWCELRPVLKAAGATVTERPRTAADDEPRREGGMWKPEDD
jgi:hypothetical protein